VGGYGSVEHALRDMPASDVLLLDIHLPGLSGIDGVRKLKAKHPNMRIIMLTVFEDESNIFRAILEGADGYLLKKTPPLRLLQAIEDAASGGAPMTPSVARQALSLFKNHVPLPKGENPLTDRECEILACLVDGMSNEEIAQKHFISHMTVRNHIRHIYEKLHVHSKSQAVVKALREGLI
jgi:DNA-binding NarL/FixJ family response regulator